GPTLASKFLPELTTLVLLRGLSVEADQRFENLTNGSAGHVGGYWKAEVTGEFEQTAKIADASAERMLIPHHLGTGSKALVPVPNGMASASYIKQNCADCHKNAVAKWLTTKHASAMDTLRARMRDDDPRCVPCHSVKHETSSLGAKVAGVHHGVQCENCHKDGVKPIDICKDCHNGLTDPKKHFLAYIKSTCNGSQDKLAGSCKKRGNNGK
ncbi:MAG: multiheme c-type cytochrome, partial [Planctomycetota bacterium]